MRQVDLILPQELYDVAWKSLEAKLETFQYARVIMPLSALLEGDFFNQYVKAGEEYEISPLFIKTAIYLLFICYLFCFLTTT